MCMEGWVTRMRFVYQLHHATGMSPPRESPLYVSALPPRPLHYSTVYTEGRSWSCSARAVHSPLALALSSGTALGRVMQINFNEIFWLHVKQSLIFLR